MITSSGRTKSVEHYEALLVQQGYGPKEIQDWRSRLPQGKLELDMVEVQAALVHVEKGTNPIIPLMGEKTRTRSSASGVTFDTL